MLSDLVKLVNSFRRLISLLIMFKLSILQRMTFTAMMIAFYMIATRFIMIPVTQAVRLSAGVAILIFSSMLLGPISGAVVGIAGDWG